MSSLKQRIISAGFTLQKKFGQNFLIDKNILKKIVRAADIRSSEKIVEVGPGLGFLTEELLSAGATVLAVEKDQLMFHYLLDNLRDKNLKLVPADILKYGPAGLKAELAAQPYRIIANLPYNITSKFIKTFLETDYPPTQMIIMVQKEVGERILAEPPDMNLLALAVNFFADPKILFPVKNTNFFPQPKVDSAILKLDNISSMKFPGVDSRLFFQLIRQGFSSKRKQLRSNLKLNAEVFISLGLTPDIRAQNLSLSDWIALTKQVGSSQLSR